MKEALQKALEPLLLIHAGALARALPAERRDRVQELARAAAVRANLARDAREPEALPAALCLGREALALSVSALLAARGALEAGALAPAAAWQALSELAAASELALPAGSELAELMKSGDPAFADALDPDTRLRLQAELDELSSAVRGAYEPRSTRELALVRMLRLALFAALITTGTLSFYLVMVRP